MQSTDNKFDVEIYLNILVREVGLAVALRGTGVKFEGKKEKWLDVRGSARAQALCKRVGEEGVEIQAPRTRERKEWSGGLKRGNEHRREGW